MSKHLLRALDDVDKDILSIGSMVEEAITKAMLALTSRRLDLAEEVMHGDDAIDRREVEFEEKCLSILALHQPVAADLRLLITLLKVNNDLERMGDLAANIAERAAYLARNAPLNVDIDFSEMVERVGRMTRKSLDALVNLDVELARQVIAEDDEVDKLNHDQRRSLLECMRRQPDCLEAALQTIIASRHLERIADHTVNIAEDVVYLVEGELIRHNADAYFRRRAELSSNNGMPI